MTTLQHANILPATQVNFGWTDKLKPPYATVTNYKSSVEWDTGNGFKHAQFTLLVIGKNVDEAETYAGEFDNFINKNTSLTPGTANCLQSGWETGLVSPDNLYQSGVRLEYDLWVDPDKGN